MYRKSRIKFRLDRDKPTLDVILSDVQIKSLGSLEGKDNVEALELVGGICPELVSPKKANVLYNSFLKIREKRAGRTLPIKCTKAGRSVKNLLSIARGDAAPSQRNPGSNIGVVVIDESGREVYRALPPESKPVERLQAKVDVIREALIYDWGLLGIPKKKIAEKEREIDDAFGKYKRVYTLSQMGFSIGEIEKQVNVPAGTGWSWIDDDSILPMVIRRLDPERRMKDVRAVSVPNTHSTSFAYLLGAHAAVTSIGHYSRLLRFSSADEEVMKRLFKAVNEIAGKTYEYRGRVMKSSGRTYYELAVPSDPLTRYVNEVTHGNSRVPWEHVVEDDEKAAFARGFFDFLGYVGKLKSSSKGGSHYPGLRVGKKNATLLFMELAVLLRDLDIIPNVTLGPRPFINIQDKAGMRQFIKKIGFTSKRMQEQVGGLDVLEYQRGGREDIAQQRRQRIDSFEDDLPDRRVIGFLFREMGLGSIASREIAKKRKLADTKEVIEALKAAGVDKRRIKESASILTLTGDEFSERVRMILGVNLGAEKKIPLPAAIEETVAEQPQYSSRFDRLVKHWADLRMPGLDAETLVNNTAKACNQEEDDIREYLINRLLRENRDAYLQYINYLDTQ